MADRDFDPVISSCFCNPVLSNKDIHIALTRRAILHCRSRTVDIRIEGLKGPVGLFKVGKEVIVCATIGNRARRCTGAPITSVQSEGLLSGRVFYCGTICRNARGQPSSVELSPRPEWIFATFCREIRQGYYWKFLYHLHNGLNRVFFKLTSGNTYCFLGLTCDSLAPSASGETDGQMQQSRGAAADNCASLEDTFAG